ncbi:hypothetical protein BaRGS_00004384 [Batillaria attramentaria]|uniref:Uncharacterized protein n=1 Tax=Batillaria attramentaria TaxID=370345 RepID=A0ABD0LYH9_9CAEN
MREAHSHHRTNESNRKFQKTFHKVFQPSSSCAFRAFNGSREKSKTHTKGTGWISKRRREDGGWGGGGGGKEGGWAVLGDGTGAFLVVKD